MQFGVADWNMHGIADKHHDTSGLTIAREEWASYARSQISDLSFDAAMPKTLVAHE